MKSEKGLGWVFPLFMVSVLIQGCGKTTNSPPSADTSTPKADEPPGKAKPEVHLTAKQYAEDCKGGVMPRMHAGKMVELTGAVDCEDYSTVGDFGVIVLRSGPGVIDVLSCSVSEKEPWKKVLYGQTVALRGRLPSDEYGMKKFEWEIGEVSGPKPPTLAADDLLKQLQQDYKKTNDAALGKPFIVTGKLTRAENGGTSLTDPERTLQIKCIFSSSSDRGKSRNKTMKVGQDVKIMGIYSGGGGFTQCQLLEDKKNK